MFDFSTAQRLGHELAFADAMIEGFGPLWNTLTLDAQAEQRDQYRKQATEFQKGCEVHFYRSQIRIEGDTTVVPAEKHVMFRATVDRLLSPGATMDSFNAAVADLRAEFPGVKNWIDWWLHPKIAAMIFPACRTMDPELASQLPDTSNPIETQHSLLHHATGTHRELDQGIEELSLHVAEMKRQYDAISGMLLALHRSTAANW